MNDSLGSRANFLTFEPSSHGTSSSASEQSIQEKSSSCSIASCSRYSSFLTLASDEATRSPPTSCSPSGSPNFSWSFPMDSHVQFFNAVCPCLLLSRRINPTAREVVADASSRSSSSKTLPTDRRERFQTIAHPKIPTPMIRKSGTGTLGLVHCLEIFL